MVHNNMPISISNFILCISSEVASQILGVHPSGAHILTSITCLTQFAIYKVFTLL